MQVNLAIVGPQEFVPLVAQAAGEFPLVRALPFPYFHEGESPCLAEEAREGADVILFCGPVPHHLAHRVLNAKDKAMHIPYRPSAFLEAMTRVFRSSAAPTPSVSVDTLRERELKALIDDLDLPVRTLFVREYQGALPTEQLVDFHSHLWRQGRCTDVVTCLHSAYRLLKEAGLPAHCARPVPQTVRHAIRRAVFAALAGHQPETPRGVAIVSLGNREEQDPYSNPESQHQYSDRQAVQVLTDYATRLAVQVFPLHRGEHLLLLSQRHVRRSMEALARIPQVLCSQAGTMASVGIGLGNSAAESFSHAMAALQRAQTVGRGRAFLVTADAQVLGPIDSPAEQSRHSTESKRNECWPERPRTRATEPWALAVAERTGLSAVTVARIRSLLEAPEGNVVTAEELALGLQVSVRHARRLLNALLDGGYATVAGDEQASRRGRRRLVYRIRLPEPG